MTPNTGCSGVVASCVYCDAVTCSIDVLPQGTTAHALYSQPM